MGWVGGREDKLNFKSNNRRMGSYGSHGTTNIVGNKHSGWDWEQGGSYAGALEEKRCWLEANQTRDCTVHR